MRLDQVQEMLDNAGVTQDGETEIYLTDANQPRLLVYGPEQTFYIVAASRRSTNVGGFKVYHPWAVPDFPRAQVHAEVTNADELLAYLTLHFGDAPVVFLDEDEKHIIDLLADGQDELPELGDY